MGTYVGVFFSPLLTCVSSIQNAINMFNIHRLGFVKPPKLSYNKWRFFINATYIHPQISLNLLNVVSIYNLCNLFADKCLKKKLLIDIYALYYAESK